MYFVFWKTFCSFSSFKRSFSSKPRILSSFRIVKPPGGECSDIFGVQNGASPKQDQITPRKTKNYMQSNIFSPDTPDSGSPNGHTPVTPAKVLDTQERLFGGSPDEDTPRRVVYRQRSSIFEDEVSYSRNTPRTTPGQWWYPLPLLSYFAAKKSVKAEAGP